MEPTLEHEVELERHRAASGTPRPNLGELKPVRSSDLRPVLVRDGVPPRVQLLKLRASSRPPTIESVNLGPESPRDKATEVRADGPWVGVPLVELTVQREQFPQHLTDVLRLKVRREPVGGFRVQVAAEGLKVTCEENGIGVVHTERRVPTSGTRATPTPSLDGAMGSFDLVERAAALADPTLKRSGHAPKSTL
ncbi:MAG: hypothetical protein ACRELB_20235, partial [Polyangiaceae bacterium]